METLQVIWSYALPIAGGVTIGAIITFIATLVFKSLFNRFINKVNIDKIEEKAVEKGVEKVKEISFSQSIEPIAKSELKKVTEEANKYIEDNVKLINDNYQNTILIIKKFAEFFDNSIAIPQEKKDELHKLIDGALSCDKNVQKIEVKEVKEDNKDKVSY